MTILDIFILCTTYSRITIIGVKIADLKNGRCNPLGKANDAKIVVITMKFFDVLLLVGNFLSFFTERFFLTSVIYHWLSTMLGMNLYIFIHVWDIFFCYCFSKWYRFSFTKSFFVGIVIRWIQSTKRLDCITCSCPFMK